MAKTDELKPDEPKTGEPQGAKQADAELASAYERIKTAQEDLARLDRRVSGMEHAGDAPIPQRGTGTEGGGAAVSEAAPSQTISENRAADPGARRGRPVMLAVVGFLLAVGIVGAAFASRYGNQAKAIMAQWAPTASVARKEATEPRAPATSLMAQAADAGQQPSPPAASSPKETKDVPSPVTATPVAAVPADRTSADPAQSLQTITHDLASINQKLDALKSGYDQTLHEQADAIQQLKTAHEQDARDKARIAAQIQAVQAQLTALSAKSATPSPKKETDAAARAPRPSVVASPRPPKRPSAPWRRRYTDEYWEDSYW